MHYLDDLGRAIKYEDIATVRRLIASGRDVNATCGLHPDTAGETPLMIAASRGNTLLISLLLDAGAIIEVQWPGDWSPLARAAAAGSAKAVVLLLQRGASTAAIFGGRPIAEFIRREFKEHPEILTLLPETAA